MFGCKLPHLPLEAVAGVQDHPERRPGVHKFVLRAGEFCCVIYALGLFAVSRNADAVAAFRNFAIASSKRYTGYLWLRLM